MYGKSGKVARKIPEFLIDGRVIRWFYWDFDGIYLTIRKCLKKIRRTVKMDKDDYKMIKSIQEGSRVSFWGNFKMMEDSSTSVETVVLERN